MEQTVSGAERAGPVAPSVEVIPIGALAANCYVLVCPRTRACVIVDPGAEPEAILERVRALGADVVAIAHTHGHFDHVSATEAVLAGLSRVVPIYAHPADGYLYEPAARQMGVLFGYPVPETLARPDAALEDGGGLAFGDVRLRVVHTPGHTPGSVSLVCGDELVLAGDTLFRRGIGRTDLSGGDEEAIHRSIVTRLYPLPEAMIVYPGHGPATTIGEERRHNPFVQADESSE